MTKLEELVIDEATKLKEFASKDELDNLNYDTLSGESKYNCIYGQMTGNCLSNRAYNLIKNCCERVYKPGNRSTYLSGVLAGKLNGAPVELDYPSNRLSYYVSPIENFLFKNKKDEDADSYKVKQLVAYLKGETYVLDFKKV